MPGVNPPSDAVRETTDRLESLARYLLRLEEGVDPTAASAAVTAAVEVASAVAGASVPVDRLAGVVVTTTAAIRDGSVRRTPELCGALILAAGALSDSVLGQADEASADEAAATLAATVAVTPGPSSESVSPPVWPAPGGPVPPELLGPVTTETLDSLQEAESALLDLESQEDQTDAVNRLFRAIHSIKGAAGYAGLPQIRTLAHKIENVLALVRGGRLPIAGSVTEFALLGVDHLKGMIAGLTPAGEASKDLAAFVAALDALCVPPPVAKPSSPSDSDPQHLVALMDGLRAVANGDCSDAVLARLRAASNAIKAAGPTPDAVVSADELLTIVDQLATARERIGTALIATPSPAFAGRPANAALVVPTSPPTPPPPLPPAKGPPIEARVAAKTMRVDQRKLDDYLNLAGELVIARNSLVHALRQLHGDRSPAAGLKDAVEKVCRIIGDVQVNAMGMRMVPVGTVFQRVPRLVRDVAKTLGKEIELVLSGEETELDKQVAEGLSDPLVHLIRNAADHGIESPEARRAADKPACGTITLRAGREGNAIVIDIQDDGGGIDGERLKAKAVATGVVTADQAAAMTREQTLELIFAPGLSTAKVVNDLSGRGVGMDVVRNNIAALGGAVSIRSEPGQGTCIRLNLPLTLAVTTVVLVESNGMTYGLPIDAVQETLKVPSGGFRQLRGVRAIALRGDVIPVKPLDRLVGLVSNPAFRDDIVAGDREPVVVLAAAGSRFGVSVTALKGQQEIVLKPVPAQLGQIEGVSGATIMGDGGIVLILDPAGLYRRATTVEVASPCW